LKKIHAKERERAALFTPAARKNKHKISRLPGGETPSKKKNCTGEGFDSENQLDKKKRPERGCEDRTGDASKEADHALTKKEDRTKIPMR